ncbi:hypothetical protein JD844_004386 [Phrynosoma platyrhinos]|uniref:Uncharacterized protein n=1 Tax=Phrynosoma platyrhinos TaxID=52577 RepID=A0ABQ7TMU7_PHRPL|nr:hypothetical protein JD844_004386 [Phrynosoma platyrhinos]
MGKLYLASMTEPSIHDVFFKMPPSESFQEPDETSSSEAEGPRESKKGGKSSFLDKIKGICPCLKKKKKAPTSDTESTASVPSEAEAEAEAETKEAEEPVSPEGVSHYVSDSRSITTVPPSLSPASPEREQKQRPKNKKKVGLTPPSEATEPKSGYSIFQASNQPLGAHVQEPPKLPKGILKTSEEKIQVGKSVSIILPPESNEEKPPPALTRKQSTTHFQSQEMSPAMKDNVPPPSGEGAAPESPAKDSHKEGPSSPVTSLRSQVPRPSVPSAGAPLQNATAEDPPKIQEEILQTVTVPEASPPKAPSPYSTDQKTLPTSKTSTIQLSSEKMVPTSPSPAYQFKGEVDGVPVTSLRNQRRAHLFARASAPSRKTEKKSPEKEKEKEKGKGKGKEEEKEKEKEKEKEESEKDSGKAKKEAKAEPLARPPPQFPVPQETSPAKDASLTQAEKTPPEPPTGQVYMEDIPLPTLSPEPKTHSPVLEQNGFTNSFSKKKSEIIFQSHHIPSLEILQAAIGIKAQLFLLFKADK